MMEKENPKQPRDAHKVDGVDDLPAKPSSTPDDNVRGGVLPPDGFSAPRLVPPST